MAMMMVTIGNQSGLHHNNEENYDDDDDEKMIIGNGDGDKYSDGDD